ncbi:hypothetical protein LTR02_005324 [Friedmanniomyces endolithicus]|nr:hypothetical protein LTR94_022534 [Friedmanniomyces endolithicus]KAK0768088.1 hypothetical protein LTR59_017938 [Friedmanniomyces endolithicus]KAK0770321.1 hypothetical protein LTR75_017945 [Friedmanniomyces endolithicus]KAK0770591.1 hypothetical protein LTR38_017534 [Friedmanniomyces endolithicus]KAK0861120.1 hypothetical protein LTS02_007994 [Friedmanniomyces endolithicus]
MFLAAILVQRGLYTKVMDMLVARKDKFLDAMNESLGDHADYQSIIAYSTTLDRLIANVVTSLQTLDLGVLGLELVHEGPLPDALDFQQYVPGDAMMFTVAKEAEAIGCQFHDEILLVELDTTHRGTMSKRVRVDHRLLTKHEDPSRTQRIDILRASPGKARYSTVNLGPTGRAMAPALRRNFEEALSQSCDIHFTIEVDLKTGIGEILLGQDRPKGILHCPALHLNVALDNELSLPATIDQLDNLLSTSPPYGMGYLNFPFIKADSKMWNQLVLTFLVVKGWWWSKHLIRDLPERLFVPTHNAYFSAMAFIGATMLHLEQNSGCSITTNNLIDGLRLLTNLGGIHEPMTFEAMTYAAQGPGGTLVHHVLPDDQRRWSDNPYLVYIWLTGKFMTVPEVALFAHGPEFRIPKSNPEYKSHDTLIPGLDGDIASPPAATIFADCTAGHTLRCAIITQKRKIRVLPLSRVLCGTLLAYIGCDPACTHDSTKSAARQLNINVLPWSVVQDEYYGIAEVEDEETVLVTGTEGSRLGQAMALAVTTGCTAIDTRGCLECAFSRSSHVIRTA